METTTKRQEIAAKEDTAKERSPILAQSPQKSSEPQGKAGEAVEQVKEKVTDAYERTAEGLNKTYKNALEYGREHPGQMSLITFGAGIGIGMLLASGFSSRSSRTQRILPPVLDAVSRVARELFR
jgi:ElaB/YqjD/DUF883 family membrane-anchored ribosome-binding protein